MEGNMTGKLCNLHILNFGLALGVSWAFGIFLLGIAGGYLGWGTEMVTAFGKLYIGYEATLIGSIIGAIWGFVDGFIFGVLIAFFYNLFNRCCPRCRTSEKESSEE